MVFLQFSQFLCISGGYRVFFGYENRYKNFSFTIPLPRYRWAWCYICIYLQVNLLFIIAATTMVIIGLTLLLLAVLSTGKTRGCIYGREKARRSGQIVSAITIAISYIFLITWILIASLTAVSAFVYTSLSILCTLRAKDNDCLNFNVLSSKNTVCYDKLHNRVSAL